MVERLAVNEDVRGSSPLGGARLSPKLMVPLEAVFLCKRAWLVTDEMDWFSVGVK